MCKTGIIERRNEVSLEQHIDIARAIALRLKRRYPWIDSEELYSYSLWGLTMASRSYRREMGSSFEAFARIKAMYLAIDEMRKDRLVQRRRSDVVDRAGSEQIMRMEEELADPRQDGSRSDYETREYLGQILGKLDPDDRRLLLHYYADGMNFREIGRLYGKSESSISVRHKVLMARLRRMARVA